MGFGHKEKEEKSQDSLPSTGEYIAFSLKVAQNIKSNTKASKKYRALHTEVYHLGYINQIHGLVCDQQENDIILVGKHNPDRQLLTIDDFVVALQARFIHGQWPLVSIDPTEKTEKTEMQNVRFEGGIEDTQFGQDLFDADYRLKRISMGLLSPGITDLRTYWDLTRERTKGIIDRSSVISSRFWFYPVLPSVAVRKDVVAIKGLKVGVFTEVLSAVINGKKIEDLSTFEDSPGETFAKTFSDHFESLARVHPSFSRLQGLDELVALTRALEEMELKPDLSYWMKDYQVKKVDTKREVKVLKREEEYEFPVKDGVYRGYHLISGGVQLTAIAMRLKYGDIKALKEAVLKSRPTPETLRWGFVVGEWIIPTSTEMLKIEDIFPLFTQAIFLQEKKYYDEAITLYGKIIEFIPSWDYAYHKRGVCYANKGLYDQAISDFNKAIEINPMFVLAYHNRGVGYYKKGQYNKAISDYTRAIEINPRFTQSYNDRAIIYCERKQYDRAITDINKAIELNPRLVNVYHNRGAIYSEIGQYNQAISDFNRAIEINPRSAQSYNSRAVVYIERKQYERAITDINKAIEINPRLADAYHNRGAVYSAIGQYKQAISDFTKALEINPRLPNAFFLRAFSYSMEGDIHHEIIDCTKALEIKPGLVEARIRRGLAYILKSEYEKAITDFTKALEIKPRDEKLYCSRGIAYQHKSLYDLAIADFNKAIEINPMNANSYLLKASLCEKVGHIREAIDAYKKFILYISPESLADIGYAKKKIRELERLQ